jgi:hypothetical protein
MSVHVAADFLIPPRRRNAPLVSRLLPFQTVLQTVCIETAGVYVMLGYVRRGGGGGVKLL